MKTSLRRWVAVTTAGATAMVGALAMSVATTSPAHAKRVETNYGFWGSAYGSVARVEAAGVKSQRTAFSVLGCTRLAGVKQKREVVAGNVPSGQAVLDIGAVTSQVRTYRNKKLKRVGTRSVSTVASVRLGPTSGPHLAIKGLKSRAHAYATTNNDKLHTQVYPMKAVKIRANTGIEELDNLLGDEGIGGLVDVLTGTVLEGLAPEGNLEIPGLGRIALGRNTQAVHKRMARVGTVSLRVVLYGLDGVEGGGDDINVAIGRARARVYKDLPAGIMRGYAHSLRASVLDDTVKVGRLGEQLLPCQGTRGKVRSNSTAAVNLLGLNAVQVGVTRGSAWGIQRKDGRARAWTKAKVAGINLGDGALVINGIVGKAKVRQLRNGKVRRSAGGTKVASIVANGTEYKIPLFGDPLVIPGLAKIQSRIVEKYKRGIKVTALRITLLGEDENAGVVLNLGTAKAVIKKR